MKEERNLSFEYGKCKLHVPQPCTVTISQPGWGLRPISVAASQGKGCCAFIKVVMVRTPVRLMRL